MASTRFKGFVGQSYLLRNLRYDCQRTVNFYPEVNETQLGKNAEVSQLVRTPGLTQLIPSTSNPGNGMYVASNGSLYTTTQAGVYKVTGTDGSTAGWSSTLIASVALNGPVSMTDNGIDLFVVSSGIVRAINLGTNAMVTVTGVTPTTCTFIDGYVVFNNANTNQFYWTDLYSHTINGLNFASAEANSDNIVAVLNNNEDLWLFGEKTTELWYDAGQGTVVFARRSGILIETGCAAAASVCKADQNRIIWLSKDDRSGPTVVMATGYATQRISTFAAEQQWSSLSQAQIKAATAHIYTQEGHTFYVLNIPGLASTWVYDVTTSAQLQQNTWHERTYTNPSTGAQSRHLAEGHQLYLNRHCVLDYTNGALYFYDQDGFSDNGANITRMRVTPHISNDGKRVFYNWLAIDVKTGIGTIGITNPSVMLDYSNDGGNTWSNITSVGAGKAGVLGSYNTRVIFHQLGQARDRVFRVSMTDQVDWAISGAALDATPAEW
jgi:hypothetical protein